MFSIELITQHNGWSQAFAGALIVMCGLTVLSLIISQLHKVVVNIGRKDIQKTAAKSAAEGDNSSDVQKADNAFLWPLSLNNAAEHLKPLTASLGSTFELKELFTICRENDIPHPHLTIKSLRDADLLKSQGGGIFSWD